jgi:hypothetical protein
MTQTQKKPDVTVRFFHALFPMLLQDLGASLETQNLL